MARRKPLASNTVAQAKIDTDDRKAPPPVEKTEHKPAKIENGTKISRGKNQDSSPEANLFAGGESFGKGLFLLFMWHCGTLADRRVAVAHAPAAGGLDF